LRLSAVSGVGGSKSLPLFAPETGVGLRAKSRSFKRCGEIYRRVHWNNRGCRSIVWRCVSRLEEKGSNCTSPTVNEEVLQAAVVKAINELLASKDTFLSTLQANIETVLNEEHDKITNDIDVKLEELQNELLRLANSKTDYEEVAEEIYRLREQKQNALVENADREEERQRIAEMSDFLNEQSCELGNMMSN